VDFVPLIQGFLPVIRQGWSKVHGWYKALSVNGQTIVDNLIIWSLAALFVWWVSRGLSIHTFVKALHDARIWLYVVVKRDLGLDVVARRYPDLFNSVHLLSQKNRIS
jgi:hypothetical protein